MTAIAKYLEAAYRRPAVDVTELGHAARNAADEVRELMELCREHFSTEQTIEYPERRWEREKRIRELVR